MENNKGIKKLLRQIAVLFFIFVTDSTHSEAAAAVGAESAASSSSSFADIPVSSFAQPASSGAGASPDYSSLANQAFDKGKQLAEEDKATEAPPAPASDVKPEPQVVSNPAAKPDAPAGGEGEGSNVEISSPKTVSEKETTKAVTYGGFSDRTFGRIARVSNIVRTGANENNAILVELVNVNSKEMADQIASISVKDWFNYLNPNIEKLKESEKIKVFRWQIVPEPEIEESLIKVDSDTIKSFLFIRYHNNFSIEPLKLNPFKNTLVVFDTDVYEVKQFPKDKNS